MNRQAQGPAETNVVPRNMLLAFVVVLTIIAVGAVLRSIGPVFFPLVIAWFLLQICRPILLFGKKMKLPHIVNVLLVFVVFFLLCLGIIKFGTMQVAALERIFTQYASQLGKLVADVFELLQIPEDSVSVVALLRRYMSTIYGSVLTFSSQFFMTIVFLLFMLFEFPGWDKKVEKAFGPKAEQMKRISNSIAEQTGQYLRTMVFVSFLTGVCVWATLVLLGIELAPVWGVVAFFLNFIPAIGPFIAVIPPTLMALLQFSLDAPEPFMVLVLLTIIQMVTGNIIAPKLFGDRLGLSPVVILLSLLVWGMLLGIPGAILSIPITSIVKIVCENIPSLYPMAVMMGTGKE
ncbi:AI-2E family transporter [Desulfovibrio cuneatus]|uniref:AI-2E family transporter n=1 Tax=Desulfovibrio cuneatus TaxID=159728 RepID=UPI0004117A5C|nr:AI-2E family transporter [Desulfovibrio cuneatus]